ncbi:MAG TPA: Hsp70 family protein [Actinospica sp.]|jgi:hypothetical protein|nr:Hsp70 family protein [Actinospica sp.]
MTVYGIDLGLTSGRIAWSAVPGAPADRALVVPAGLAFAPDGAVRVGAADDQHPRAVPGVRALLAQGGAPRPGSPLSAEASVGTVLAELTERARAEGGGTAVEAVLAVPGDFDVAATAALRRAAESVGLTVRGTVPAALAVCLHYGAVDWGVDRNILVCDLGATRLELTVLAVRSLSVEILHSAISRIDDVEAADRAARVAGLVAEAARSVATVDVEDVLLAGAAAADAAVSRAIVEAIGVAARCTEPDFAVAKGCVRFADFGYVRVKDGRGEGPERRTPRSTVARHAFQAASTPPDDDPEPRARVVDDPDPRVRRPERPAPAPTPPAPAEERQVPPVREPRPSPSVVPPIPAMRPPMRSAVDAKVQPPPIVEGPDIAADGPTAYAPRPVVGLAVIRRTGSAVLSWQWPPDGPEARVHWRIGTGSNAETGTASVSRHAYDNQGGFSLEIGPRPAEFTVEVLVPGSAPSAQPPSSAVLPAPPTAVRYDLTLVGGRRKRMARFSFTGDVDCILPDIVVVYASGRYLPSARHEGREIHRVPGGPLQRNQPFETEFSFVGFGPGWLVCFPEESAVPIALHPVSLHRLRVV